MAIVKDAGENRMSLTWKGLPCRASDAGRVEEEVREMCTGPSSGPST